MDIVPQLTIAIWRPCFEEATRDHRGWTATSFFVTEVKANSLRHAFWKAWIVGAIRIGDAMVVDPEGLEWHFIVENDGIWSLDGKGRKYQISEEWTRWERMVIKALRLGLPR